MRRVILMVALDVALVMKVTMETVTNVNPGLEIVWTGLNLVIRKMMYTKYYQLAGLNLLSVCFAI